MGLEEIPKIFETTWTTFEQITAKLCKKKIMYNWIKNLR